MPPSARPAALVGAGRGERDKGIIAERILRPESIAYRAEDGHLDALVRLCRDAFEQADGNARLIVRLLGQGVGADGEGGPDAGVAPRAAGHHAEPDDYAVLLEQEIAPLPHPQVHFSHFWPESMAGQEGCLEIVLMGEGGR